MLVKTLRRLTARPDGETPIFLIASERHAERVHADLAGLDLAGGGPLFEPTGRNTAAAVALATLRTLSEFGDSLVLVVPSDHEISTARQFWQSVEAGAAAARAGRLVVFGIKPTQPETGYGYIEVAGARAAASSTSRASSKSPTSRPRRAISRPAISTGIPASSCFAPAPCATPSRRSSPRSGRRPQAAYQGRDSEACPASTCRWNSTTAIPSNSIDYADHGASANDIAMVPAGFRWNDLGSWQSLLDVGPADKHGNVIVGDVVAIDCENSYIRSDGRLLSAIGMKDVAIVSTADATFVAPVSHSQHVKKIVEQLEKSGRLETRFTPAHDRVIESGAWRRRVHHWLFEETLPLWSTSGVDERHGGFHEALASTPRR